MARLSEDDLSLLDYLNNANATDAEYSLSNEDISILTKQYLDRFYPDNKDVVINTEDKILEDCIAEGTYTGIKGETDFYIQMDGDGKLYKIGISTQIDMSNLEKIEMATAIETAIDTIVGECSFSFADRENLKLMSSEEYKDEYKEVYSFAFEYISSNPTVRDYSFTAEIDVDVYSNKPRTWRVDYINDGLNTISEEEAVTLARQYIVEEFNVDANKLVYKEFIVITGYLLEFQVNFDYDDGRSFGASMYADTGELDGIGWGD